MHEVEMRAQKLYISRGEYIRKSIENMNKKIQEEENKDKLIEASIKVRQESMIINSEFSMIEDETLENLPKY